MWRPTHIANRNITHPRSHDDADKWVKHIYFGPKQNVLFASHHSATHSSFSVAWHIKEISGFPSQSYEELYVQAPHRFSFSLFCFHIRQFAAALWCTNMSVFWSTPILQPYRVICSLHLHSVCWEGLWGGFVPFCSPVWSLASSHPLAHSSHHTTAINPVVYKGQDKQQTWLKSDKILFNALAIMIAINTTLWSGCILFSAGTDSEQMRRVLNFNRGE